REASRKSLQKVICCANHDTEGYLKLVGDEMAFESAFLQGKLAAAAESVGRDQGADVISQRGLLYLSFSKKGDQQAAEAQWQPLLDALGQQGRRGRQFAEMLTGKRAVDFELVRRLTLDPRHKRVVVAVAAKRFPEFGKDLSALAQQLDFHRDPTSLCLRQATN